MPTGTVKFFNVRNGFGFIEPDDGSEDVFVDIEDLLRSGFDQLKEGQKVSFEVVFGQGQPNAFNVKTIR